MPVCRIMAKKKIAVLGATGSIGTSALDVISHDKDNFEIVLLSAHTRKNKLEELGKQWPNAKLALSGVDLLKSIHESNADLIINGISGAAGLEPSFAAIEAGAALALANKETIVMAGQLLLENAVAKNIPVIPVDSEHSAVFHLLNAHNKEVINEIILTASGGPFRDYSVEQMKNISVNDALAHPTWNMGPKITVDSATMANKGLEVIEAARLFSIKAQNIKVVIHPQSIVHSLIRTTDGTVYASLSIPDMRLPIKQALYWPQTVSENNQSFTSLSFDSLKLEFYQPDMEKFPMLKLAYYALEQDGFYPCVYNSANETAVSAFFSGEICFLDIQRITEYVLLMDWSGKPNDIESVLETHKRAGKEAYVFIQQIRNK